MERQDGMLTRRPAMVLMEDLFAVWRPDETFVGSSDLIARLIQHNPEFWSSTSSYGRALTAQRMGRMLSEGFKVYSGDETP